MVSSFHPHSMCKKVERVTAKIGCTSCTKRTVSFELSGFHMETRLLQGDFFFWTYLNSRLFVCSKCTIQSHIINFQHFLTSFAIFQSFTNLFKELNDREIENHYKMKYENVGTWHGIIISPTENVLKSWEGYGKTWMHFVYKTNNLFQSIMISYGNLSVTKGFHFLNLIWNPDFLCVQNAPFKATSSFFNPFWLH